MSRLRSRLFSGIAITALLATSGVVTAISPPAPAAAATESVTLVGDFQTELGCTEDWQATCNATALTDADGDGVWTGEFTVPAGSYEFKVAINGTWDESYGMGDGNYPLSLAADATLEFAFDDRTNKVSLDVAGLPGGYAEADDALVRAPFRDPGSGNTFYFVMTDRFDNGDPTNDACIATGHVGADGVLPVDCTGTDRLVTGFDATDKGFFNGGDVQGLRDRLDYIDGLGATAIWLTPSFVNRPVQGTGADASAGYHGYWITDFTQIDPHLGTNAELKAFIAEAHAKGIKVYFDIIANHTADVIHYAGLEGTNPPYVSKAASPYKDVDGNEFDPSDYADGAQAMPLMHPDTRSFPYDPEIPAGMEEAKFPLWLNDPTLYHNRGFDPSWPQGEPAVYMDFGDLDDLMTENQKVVDGMTEIYKAWADFGIDGFRIDTVKHVDFVFWQEFTEAVSNHADDEFFMFGEVYDADARLLSPYVRDTDMNSVLDFAYQSSAENFAKGFTTRGLSGLFAADDFYTTADSSAASLPTFLGNHDMGRIGFRLSGADNTLQRSELAHELMFLTRGQPVVYYGDEQGFVGDGDDKDARENMFVSQVPSYLDNVQIDGTPYGAGPHFDTAYPLYQHISALAELRHSTPALESGAQIELHSEAGAGVYAFSRVDRTEKIEHLVALNNTTTAQEVSLTTLTDDASYAPLYGATEAVSSGSDGGLTLTVPALSAVVYKADGTVTDAGDAQAITVTSAAPVNGLTPITADVADGRWAETSFAYRPVGSSSYTALGTAETDQPRVFADFGDLAAGTLVEVRAVSTDADGSKVAHSATVVVGTDLGAAAPEAGEIDWSTAVTVPGSHNAAMGCAGDWDPGCEEALLTLDETSGLYTGTFSLPAGSYEYKVAIGGNWDVNYGVGSVPNGDNAAYTLDEATDVTFFYNPVTHLFFNTAQSPIVTLPGSHQAAVGCSGDWQPECLATLMFPNGDGTYTWSTTSLPAGSYEVKVAHGMSWDENYGAGGAPGGGNYTFTTAAQTQVVFTYDIDTHLLEITVEDPPLAGTGSLLGHWIDAETIAWPTDLAPGDRSARTWELWTDPDGGLALVDGVVTSDGAVKVGDLTLDADGLTADQLENRGHLSGFLALKLDADRAAVEAALTGDLAVVQRNADGLAEVFTGLQVPGVLDDLCADAARAVDLGVTFTGDTPSLTLWAPTAKNVTLLLHGDATGAGEPTRVAMTRDDSGLWSVDGEASWKNRAYRFDVEVFVPSLDEVTHNVVTDPYSVGLTRNSTHSVLVDLDDPAWAPEIWTANEAPVIEQFADRTIYELHIRDFSVSDETVPEELRGTYEAFALEGTDGVEALTELADAGMNTVHLLPSFDIATIEEDRSEQVHPVIPDAGPASEEQQAAVTAVADQDAFNWGYDPYHYSTPEGSYASDENQEGGKRTSAFREMVGGLHGMGLQVVLDKVYNHTAQSGQAEKSVLDKVVPGYYHRLSLTGTVETSTCCENVATEHEMAEQLMVDSVVTWARDYHVDGFRFDLMGHHSRANMEAVRAALDELTLEADGVDGANMYLYGEGWNFGEVADNARFHQATQGQLGGTGIGAFNDRLRDAVHGGGPFDSNKSEMQGFGTGLYTDPNGVTTRSADEQLRDLRHRQDLVRIGMAGNLAEYSFETSAGTVQKGSELDYNGARAGYATEPHESVNYVDAHDNETLFDLGMWKLPSDSTMDTRVRMNTVSLATVALGQAPSFWHAGTDLLRSKSMDRDSYNSGDHFNTLDWSMQTNNFGVGLPPAEKNSEQWDAMRQYLENPANTPTPQDIATSRARALELLELRSTYPLLTLGSADAITEKVTFPNAGADQTAGLILMHIDDTVGADVDPEVDSLLVAINASPEAIVEEVDGLAGAELELSPILTEGDDADPVLATTAWDAASGTLTVPARSAVVLVQPQEEVVDPTPEPTVEPTVDPTVDPTEDPTTPPVKKYVRTAPYTMPGLHRNLNGRDWHTECEPYSQTERCRTDIWATIVVIEDGQFVRKDGWAFNNLTYLPFMTREAWGANPLANDGEWTASTDARKWMTECDTARTGRDGCRSYAFVTVYKATAKPEGGYAFSQSNQWVFNNIVMFGGPELR
ncbi:pullulanase-type alpha-1,6-glucosidase [Tessaracoccus massiliensis]|uniref:pullulanase-type alpha-1,6-glucosidase n=1 Tax=Tessaracoccus massiliensis TaxID=1522311 RepID=UPI0009E1FABC|nr:pullulanase-type alpha-1,6-glucosidase [Tessaracoccus massiliensis]